MSHFHAEWANGWYDSCISFMEDWGRSSDGYKFVSDDYQSSSSCICNLIQVKLKLPQDFDGDVPKFGQPNGCLAKLGWTSLEKEAF